MSIVDTDLGGDFDPEEAYRFLKVGLLCTQDSPKLRPAMSAVVQMLAGKKDVSLEVITRPGFISDFGDLKIKGEESKVAIENTLSSEFSRTDKSSAVNSFTCASITFTAICDRED